jgi:hypothetical protein
MKEEKIDPVYYDGKYWEEEDCDDVFVAFYHTRWSLNIEMGVYVSEGTWVYPDGSFGEW